MSSHILSQGSGALTRVAVGQTLKKKKITEFNSPFSSRVSGPEMQLHLQKFQEKSCFLPLPEPEKDQDSYPLLSDSGAAGTGARAGAGLWDTFQPSAPPS